MTPLADLVTNLNLALEEEDYEEARQIAYELSAIAPRYGLVKPDHGPAVADQGEETL